jgi:hypothetical protein
VRDAKGVFAARLALWWCVVSQNLSFRGVRTVLACGCGVARFVGLAGRNGTISAKMRRKCAEIVALLSPSRLQPTLPIEQASSTGAIHRWLLRHIDLDGAEALQGPA